MPADTSEQTPAPPPVQRPEATWWTYQPVGDPDGGLGQGDILTPSRELRSVLGEGHEFCKPEYLAFIVTTQDCDLVIRENNKCDADYISLAGVVSLQTILPLLLDMVCGRLCETDHVLLYAKRAKEQARNLLNRILNQDAWKIGLFYLHEDHGAGIGEPAIALLRVCTSIKTTQESYAAIKNARKGQLDPLFRAKLGWTVGNLYSRVGTPDWGDKNKEDIDKKNKLMDRLIGSDEYYWVPSSWVSSARNAGVEIEQLPLSDLMSTLEQHKPRPFYETVAAHVKKLLATSFPGFEPQDLDDFEKVLRQDGVIQTIKSKAELKE